MAWTAIGLVLFVGVLCFVRDHRTLARYGYTAGFAGLVLLALPGLLPSSISEVNGAQIWLRLRHLLDPARRVRQDPADRVLRRVPGAEARAVHRGGTHGSSAWSSPAPATSRRCWSPGRSRSASWCCEQRPRHVAAVLRHRARAALRRHRTGLVDGHRPAVVPRRRASWPTSSSATSGCGCEIWLDPFADFNGAGYQIGQALFGLGTGGVGGTGLGAGRPDLVPYAESDFMLSSLGEELGLIGLAAILVVYLVLITRGLRSALAVRDSFGKLLATGLSFALALQLFVVVGGVTEAHPADRPDHCRSCPTAARRWWPTTRWSRCCCGSPTPPAPPLPRRGRPPCRWPRRAPSWWSGSREHAGAAHRHRRDGDGRPAAGATSPTCRWSRRATTATTRATSASCSPSTAASAARSAPRARCWRRAPRPATGCATSAPTPTAPVYATVTGFYSVLYGATGIERATDEVLNGSDDRLFARRLSDLITGRDPQRRQRRADHRPGRAAGRLRRADRASDYAGAVVALAARRPGDPGDGLHARPTTRTRWPATTRDDQTAAWTEVQRRGPAGAANRAISATYPPGSTFKLVDTAAALQNGFTPDSQLTGGAEDHAAGHRDARWRTSPAPPCGTAADGLAARCAGPLLQHRVRRAGRAARRRQAIRDAGRGVRRRHEPTGDPADRSRPSTLGDIPDTAALQQSGDRAARRAAHPAAERHDRRGDRQRRPGDGARTWCRRSTARTWTCSTRPSRTGSAGRCPRTSRRR